eukprot:jgi/Tetstr1/424887/TSEL_015382.t1
MRLRKPVCRTAHTTRSRMAPWWQPHPDVPKEAMRSNNAAWASRRRPNARVIHPGSGGSSEGEYSGSVGARGGWRASRKERRSGVGRHIEVGGVKRMASAAQLLHNEEGFANTLRLDMAMSSPLALLWVADTHHVIINLTEPGDDPGTLSINPTCLEFADEGDLSRRDEAAKRLRRGESSRKKREGMSSDRARGGRQRIGASGLAPRSAPTTRQNGVRFTALNNY